MKAIALYLFIGKLIINNFIKNNKKKAMRVMKAFEIETNYQKHKNKLT